MGWPMHALLDLLEIDLPIVQAPMAGAHGPELPAAISAKGALGSLPCATLDPDGMRQAVAQIRGATNRGFSMNFFVHKPPVDDEAAEARWHKRLAGYYAETGAEPPLHAPAGPRPFDAAMCEIVEEVRPRAVSFHFGLPDEALLMRVKATGAKVLCSATTVEEARHLDDNGVDVVIAQGAEAGGHRGMFLTEDVATQIGTLALVPQVVDAVGVPVIAAGGIADGRAIAAAFALGASGVQIGTAFLRTPEARISDLHRAALAASRDSDSVITNVFSGRPARALKNRLIDETGPLCPDVPAFPLGLRQLGPLRAAAEQAGSSDFTPLWAGQAATFARAMPAGELVALLAEEALARLEALSA